MRGFKFQMFSDNYAWDYVMKPKAPALVALNSYLSQWEDRANSPFSLINVPKKSMTENAVISDDALSPDSVRKVILRHYYKNARLRVLYAGLRARAAGLPASLGGIVDPRLLEDPFTGTGLGYTRSSVYSAGPDGQNNAGTPLEDNQLQPHSQGDLVFPLTR